jgi:MFS family permease
MNGARARVVTILLLSYITFAMFGTSLGVAIPDIMVELSIDELKAGILYSANLWSSAALLAPAGYLADRFERKSILLLGYLLVSLGVIGLSFSSTYFCTFAFLILSGVGGGILGPTYYTLVGEILENVRGFAIGLAAGMFYIGGLIGSILVGFFVSLHQWRIAYLIVGVLIFCMFILQLITLKLSSTTYSKPHLFFSNLLKTRNTAVCALGMFLGSVAIFAAAAWLPTFFLTVTQLEAIGAGLLLGLLFLARAISTISIGALSDKYGRKTLLMISGFAAAFVTLPLLLTYYTFYVAAAYVFAYGFLTSPYWNLFITISQESVSKEQVASATGLTQTFGLIGGAVGPIVAGALIPYVRLPLALVFTMTTTTLAFGLLSLVIMEKRPKLIEERF